MTSDIPTIKICKFCGYVKVCRNCGPLKKDQVYKNGKCITCDKIRSDKYKAQHQEQIKAYRKKYIRKDQEKERERSKLQYRKQVKELSDHYVKVKISRKYHIPKDEIPSWMVEAERPILLLKRKIREKIKCQK